MCDKDRDSLRVKFNTVYYIATVHEKTFTDYPNLLELQEKNDVQGIGKNYIIYHDAGVFIDVIGDSIKNDMKTELKSLRFYSILSDGSTDSGNIEEELVYVTYLSKGTAKVSFLSMENAQNVNANGIKECIESGCIKTL